VLVATVGVLTVLAAEPRVLVRERRLLALHRVPRGPLFAAPSPTAGAGAALLGVYSAGLAVPFLGLAWAVAHGRRGGVGLLGRHHLLLARVGGGLLVVMGAAMVAGWWTQLFAPLVRWFARAGSPALAGPRSDRRLRMARPCRLLALAVGLAALLAACAPGGTRQQPARTQPTASPARSAASPAIAPDAVRISLAGFAGGPGFRLPEDLGGRPLVLNVWASWCGPCRQEMPAFQRVYLQANGKVGFLGLDYLDVESAARRFVAQTGVTYPLAADPKGRAGAKLGVASLPATLFIGADGALRGRHLGAMTAPQLRAAIQRYLEVSLP
jgi:cytochrome c biogenesis protein CcmG/thiol:disulfide interchange protein DsbE